VRDSAGVVVATLCGIDRGSVEVDADTIAVLQQLAKVIAALVDRDDLERAVVEVSSAEATTGAELARFVGTSVGRPVSYVPIAPGDFQVALSAAVGAKAAEGVAALYRWIEANPETRVFDHDASVFERLGLTPTPVREWAQRQAWKVAP